jgi:hypothetical protein
VADRLAVPAENVELARMDDGVTVLKLHNGVLITRAGTSLHVESLAEWENIDKQVRDKLPDE